MADALIENPILNSPFNEPVRHFKFADEGITNEIVDGPPQQLLLHPDRPPEEEGKAARLRHRMDAGPDRGKQERQPHPPRVGMWRDGGHVGVTPTTAAPPGILDRPERERKLFFCQIEALETIIYIAEVAKKFGDAWIEDDVRKGNDTSNPGLPRFAFKMATGSGKTVVMAMIIAWQALNKLANPQDARF